MMMDSTACLVHAARLLASAKKAPLQSLVHIATLQFPDVRAQRHTLPELWPCCRLQYTAPEALRMWD